MTNKKGNITFCSLELALDCFLDFDLPFCIVIFNFEFRH